MGCSFINFSCCNSTPQTLSCPEGKVVEKIIYVSPNPNPYKFKVLKEERLEKGMILLINYEGCTTFGGDKLLLLRCKIDLKYFGKIDPHLLGDGHIVCARFEPTEEGWNMARMAAHCL